MSMRMIRYEIEVRSIRLGGTLRMDSGGEITWDGGQIRGSFSRATLILPDHLVSHTGVSKASGVPKLSVWVSDLFSIG
jgi:hypothetical protein